ncbi:MAG: hypothetical protein FDZ69_02045 [Deltaproteobacteria bacterium]|nr:MAG: hypothetical protein FDZ69_02045 [Deltaproteobacteria bacterium]
MSIVKLFVVVAFILFGWPLSSVGGEQESLDDLSARKARFYKVVEELAKELNNDIKYYGQVVDLQGLPVAGAVVMMTVRVAGAVPPAKEFNRFEVITDERGLFFVETFGDVIGVDKIMREGYEYHYKYNPVRDLKSQREGKRQGSGFEPDKPFTFRVRKLAPASFVVLYNMTFGKKPGKPSMLDLIKRKWVHDEAHIIAMQYSSMDRDWHADVNLSVEGEAGGMKLVLDAPDADSGFVVEKQGLFEEMTEAPEAGYRRKVEFHVRREDSPAMVYVKGQGGLFYGKIHIDFMEDRPGVVAINATAFTNLSGGRGLEYIPAIESQYDWDVNVNHTRREISRADLLSGKSIELPVVSPKILKETESRE